MKVKEILKLALMFLNREDLLIYSPFGEQTTIPTLENTEIEHLKKCFNLVYNEIATAYITLIKTEQVVFIDGVLAYNKLSKTITEIRKLYANGKNIPYSLEEDGIHANVLCAQLTYSYAPEELSFEDEVFMFGGKIQDRVFAYGIAMEFCLITGLYDDAEVWETRFYSGLKEAYSKKSEIRLPSRRWI